MTPETLDGSERVEDIDKAREMAESSQYMRNYAAGMREELKKDWTPEAKKAHGFAEKAEFGDKKADAYEQLAGFYYDAGKEARGMNDRELEAAADQSISDEKVAWAEVLRLRQIEVDQPSPENKKKQEEAETIHSKISVRAHILNSTIGTRKREKEEL